MVYLRVQRLLGRLRNIGPDTIQARNSLTDDIGFTSAGLRALAVKVNEELVDLNVCVTPSETGGCETVRDLARLIFEKVPPHLRAT
ncbi:MAG TPA: hypothetical protein VF756_05810 [Thermoanaerobaculia bacterium]